MRFIPILLEENMLTREGMNRVSRLLMPPRLPSSSATTAMVCHTVPFYTLQA